MSRCANNVHPDRGFYCFGCQKGGTSIDFVMEKENLSFKEAVDLLVTSSGVVVRASDFAKATSDKSQLPRPRPAKQNDAPGLSVAALSAPQRRTALDAVSWHHQTLSGEDRRGLEYLTYRHVADPETLKTFKIGFADGSFPNVVGRSAAVSRSFSRSLSPSRE